MAARLTPSYVRYVAAQIIQAFSKRRKPPREPFIDQIIASTALPYSSTILCIGARNFQEPLAWRARGYHRAIGLDLLPSASPAMRWGDFHALPFPDGDFNLLYGSHAWEHSWDPKQALAEAIRVLHKPGYLFAAFPVGFTPTAHDRVDFGSIDGFTALLPPGPYRVLWRQTKPGEAAALIRCD